MRQLRFALLGLAAISLPVLAHHSATDLPRIDYCDVTITRSQPAERVYGGAES